MIGSDLGLVVVAPRAVSGPPLDLDFVQSRYRRGAEGAAEFAALSGSSFSRIGEGVAFTAAGATVPFGTGVARRTDRGLLLEPGRTNRVTCDNANPSGLTNISKHGDVAAVLSVIEDAAALSAAGLAGVCTGGQAYRLDNGAGSGNAIVRFVGAVGATTAHVLSIHVRMSASGGQIGLLNGSQSGFVATGPTFNVLAGYARISGSVTSDTNAREMGVRIPAGAVAHFVLMQMEEGTAASSPIVTAGATATRGAEAASVIVPAGAATWTATYGASNTVVGGSATPGETFDLVAGRPWIGVGNELKRLVMS